MDNNLYIEKDGQKLRCGYTTGSCAAAAAKAALMMLICQKEINTVSIVTPKGPKFLAEILDIDRTDRCVSCAVVKDGGDDPDVTSGMKIYAKVSFLESCKQDVIISGGEGIGKVTKPGLDQEIGEAAINSTPRRMIKENIREVLQDNGLSDKSVAVEISAPGGEEVAKKTFNPKLGIVGGISILGTTGIVKPMSDEAIVATIKTQISQMKAQNEQVLLIAPGNYGLKFLRDEYGIEEDKAVMCSNFVYDTVKMAADAGFSKLLFCGHLGKLVKVSGGIKNTHSSYGDHRMEILVDLIKKVSGDDMNIDDLCEKVMECVMTDEAVRLITEAGIRDEVFGLMAGNIKRNMELWSKGEIEAEVIVFSNEYTRLTQTDKATEFLKMI